jgi:hypothetical protein
MVDAMAGNKIYVQGSYIDIHDNENVYLSVDKAKVNVNDNDKEEVPEVATLVRCVEQVREYLWSDSALAVVFCVCRDCYGYANNMSQFERDFHCHDGLLSNTFRSNPYMRLNISKWEQQGAKQRVLRLLEAYRNAVEDSLIA